MRLHVDVCTLYTQEAGILVLTMRHWRVVITDILEIDEVSLATPGLESCDSNVCQGM